jgi:hypothetical protein
MDNKEESYHHEITCQNCWSVWEIEAENLRVVYEAKLLRCPLCSRKEDK